MPKDKVIQAAYCHITKEKKNSWLSPFWGNGRKTRHISAVRGNLFTAHSIVIPFSM